MSYVFLAGDRSCWYRFETDGRSITVIIDSVHVTAWKKAMASEGGRRLVVAAAEEFKLRPFVDDERVWGFGGCGRYDGEHSEDWDRLCVPIPSLNIEGDRDERSGREAALSLEILFTFLERVGSVTPTRPQGLHVQLACVDRVVYGGMICASVSPAMDKWFRDTYGEGGFWGEEEIDPDPITPTMRIAAARLWGSKEPTDGLFSSTRFTSLRGTPHFSCGFGGSLGVSGSSPEYGDGQGLELSPHNTDGTLNQLTILVGLARLDQLFHER